MIYLMRLRALLLSMCAIFNPFISMALEIIRLRQELVTFKYQHAPVAHVSWFQKICHWLACFSPGVLARWHRRCFKVYWNLISSLGKVTGRPRIMAEIRNVIARMVLDNPTWGAPRIHGELIKLGYRVAERSVSRYLKWIKPGKTTGGSPGWKVFIRNQRKGIVAMDFLVVPTLFFKQLYVFFIIGHDRRKLLHFNVTFHPSASWVSEQIRQTFGSKRFPCIRGMIHDRDAIFSKTVRQTLRSLGIESLRTAYHCPWQNGIAERWVGNCRRDLLDHVIILNERHLLRLLEEYVAYYNEDRTHYNLDKDPPISRPVLERESEDDTVIALPRVGGLHHKYIWQKAA